MASSGLEALPLLGTACDERDGAHLAEDLAIVEVIDRRDGRACGHGERGNLVVTVLEKDNFLAALRPRGRRALEHDAVPVRRDAPPAVLRGPRARRRRRSAMRRSCRSTSRSCSTSSPRCRRRRPSTRSCGRSVPAPVLRVRCEHVPGADAAALARKIAERFRRRRDRRRGSSWSSAGSCRASPTRRRASSTRRDRRRRARARRGLRASSTAASFGSRTSGARRPTIFLFLRHFG